MTTLLNVDKLKKMVRDGIAAIPEDPNASQAVILIGDTGVGKSTLLAFLSGAPLKVIHTGLKPVLDAGEFSVKIGHEKYSETSIPNKLMIENIAFYDCPGFKDNKGEEFEISNSFFVQRLLDIYKRVKIVLLIDESHISEARADKLPKLVKNLIKSFRGVDDIKDGVLVILNRADPGLTVSDYHKELNKMSTLANESGPLFQPDERNFLQFIVDHKRLCLFRQPNKDDKGRVFQPNAAERGILGTIRGCNFVKTKHILNILSESAKLAIRDLIDEMTNRSNIKIEAICKEIIQIYSQRMLAMGANINGLLSTKEEVMTLAEKIKSAKDDKIVEILQSQLPNDKIQDFTEDYAAVVFFKTIYDKTATYYSNLVNKIYSELSHLLSKMDNTIIKAQRDQQQQIQRQKQAQRRKQQQQQREREWQEMNQQLQKIQQIKEEVHKMGSTSMNLFESVSSIMKEIGNMEQEFSRLKDDVQTLKGTHNGLQDKYHQIEASYVNRAANA